VQVNPTIKRPLTIIGFLGLVLWPCLAQATATFDVMSNVELTILGFTDENGVPIARPDVVIEMFDEFFDPFDDSFGNASASTAGDALIVAGDPFDMVVGDGMQSDPSATGSASAPPSSGGSADIISVTSISILSNSASTIGVEFQLDWNWSLDSSATDPAQESAFAALQVVVDSGFAEFLRIDEESHTDFGGGFFSDGDSFTNIIYIDPFGFDDLQITNDVQGAALSDLTDPPIPAPGPGTPAPEPGSMILLATGLLAVRHARRHRP